MPKMQPQFCSRRKNCFHEKMSSLGCYNPPLLCGMRKNGESAMSSELSKQAKTLGEWMYSEAGYSIDTMLVRLEVAQREIDKLKTEIEFQKTEVEYYKEIARQRAASLRIADDNYEKAEQEIDKLKDDNKKIAIDNLFQEEELKILEAQLNRIHSLINEFQKIGYVDFKRLREETKQ
jgi:hypothetical protein